MGKVHAYPGSSNVVPGEVVCSLEIRHANDVVREEVKQVVLRRFQQIVDLRSIDFKAELLMDAAAVSCDKLLSSVMEKAVEEVQGRGFAMQSGAGHDAVAMSKVMPVSMLFIRSKDGVSHNPEEFSSAEDILSGLNVLKAFVSILDSENLIGA